MRHEGLHDTRIGNLELVWLRRLVKVRNDDPIRFRRVFLHADVGERHGDIQLVVRQGLVHSVRPVWELADRKSVV